MPKVISTKELFASSSKAPKTLTTAELFGKAKPPAGGMDYGQSMLYGAGQGLTFGFADEGLAGAKALYDKARDGRDFSEAYAERLPKERAELERARANSKSYMAGALGGGLATSFLPGIGWANVGKGATVAGQMGRAALAGGLAGAGESKGNLLNDQGQLAKDVALGAGTGAAFQGLLSRGSNELSKLPAFARQKSAERAVKATTGQNVRALRKMSGTTHDSAGDVEKFLGGIRKVGDDIIDEVTPSGKPLLGAFDSVEDLAPKMASARKHYGEKLGEVGKAVDSFYPEGSVDGKKIAEKLAAYAEKLPDVDRGTATIDRILTVASQFDKKGKMTFEQAKLFKNQFKHEPTNADLLVGNKDVTNKIRSIIGGQMDDTASSLEKNLSQVKMERPISVTPGGGIPPSPLGENKMSVNPDDFQKVQYIKELLGKYGHFKGKYGSFKQASDAATDRVQKNLSNRLVSPSDYGVGGMTAVASAAATGNPLMALVGVAGAAANKIARERGSSATSVALRKISELAKNPLFANKYSKKILNAAADGPTAMLGVHAVLMNTDPDYNNFFKEEY